MGEVGGEEPGARLGHDNPEAATFVSWGCKVGEYAALGYVTKRKCHGGRGGGGEDRRYG